MCQRSKSLLKNLDFQVNLGMSMPAKAVLVCACSFSLGIIGYVHFKQHLDRERLHQGVLDDVERRQRRKQENIYTLQKQSDLTKEFRKVEQESRHKDTT